MPETVRWYCFFHKMSKCQRCQVSDVSTLIMTIVTSKTRLIMQRSFKSENALINKCQNVITSNLCKAILCKNCQSIFSCFNARLCVFCTTSLWIILSSLCRQTQGNTIQFTIKSRSMKNILVENKTPKVYCYNAIRASSRESQPKCKKPILFEMSSAILWKSIFPDSPFAVALGSFLLGRSLRLFCLMSERVGWGRG